MPARLNTRVRLAGSRLWGGTFHSVATRLLRIHGKGIGLEPGFTIHDRSDSEDLLDVVRTELGLTKTNKRFPKKGTCLSIYSNCVNSRRPLDKALAEDFPWCLDGADDLKRLFQAYVDRKEEGSVLDYDDLLLFWRGLMAEPKTGDRVRAAFDCVLVDEYQDSLGKALGFGGNRRHRPLLQGSPVDSRVVAAGQLPRHGQGVLQRAGVVDEPAHGLIGPDRPAAQEHPEDAGPRVPAGASGTASGSPPSPARPAA